MGAKTDRNSGDECTTAALVEEKKTNKFKLVCNSGLKAQNDTVLERAATLRGSFRKYWFQLEYLHGGKVIQIAEDGRILPGCSEHKHIIDCDDKMSDKMLYNFELVECNQANQPLPTLLKAESKSSA